MRVDTEALHELLKAALVLVLGVFALFSAGAGFVILSALATGERVCFG